MFNLIILIIICLLCRKYRHVAYRQLTRWCWQWLGRTIRVVPPSCAVTKIRQTFPSIIGTHAGFKLPFKLFARQQSIEIFNESGLFLFDCFFLVWSVALSAYKVWNRISTGVCTLMVSILMHPQKFKHKIVDIIYKTKRGQQGEGRGGWGWEFYSTIRLLYLCTHISAHLWSTTGYTGTGF